MRGANIFTGVVGALWALLLWIGIDLINGVSAQHIAGYPSSGQIYYYIWTPFLICLALLLFALLLNRVKRVPGLLVAITLCACIFLFPYLLAYTGGV